MSSTRYEDELAAEVAELTADLERARGIAVALEQQVAAVAALAEEYEHRYEAGDHMLGCPDGAVYYDLIADEVRAALESSGGAS